MFAPSFVRLVGAVQYLSGNGRHTKKNDIADDLRIALRIQKVEGRARTSASDRSSVRSSGCFMSVMSGVFSA